MQVASTASLAKATPPSQLTDSAGHTFTALYDDNGRLSTLKRTSGRNMADMAAAYDANGRIRTIRFDNGYQLFFRYRPDGTQEVTDILGGRIVRVPQGGGAALVPQSVSDPSKYLVEILRRIEAVFAQVQAVPGLNPPPGSATAQ